MLTNQFLGNKKSSEKPLSPVFRYSLFVTVPQKDLNILSLAGPRAPGIGANLVLLRNLCLGKPYSFHIDPGVSV